MGPAFHTVERARGNAEKRRGLRVGQVPSFYERNERFKGDCREARPVALVRKGLGSEGAQLRLSGFNGGDRHSRLLTRRYASFDTMSSGNCPFVNPAGRAQTPNARIGRTCQRAVRGQSFQSHASRSTARGAGGGITAGGGERKVFPIGCSERNSPSCVGFR